MGGKVFNLLLLITVLIMHSCSEKCECVASEFQEMKLNELDSLTKDSEFIEFRNSYLSEYGERMIFNSDNEVYRYIYSGAFGRREIIRIEEIGKEYKLYVQEYDAGGEDYNQDPLIRKDEILISQADWESLKENLESNCFWNMPYLDERMGLDGYSITIEAYDPIENRCTGRNFHAVSKWVPIDSSYIRIYTKFRELSLK